MFRKRWITDRSVAIPPLTRRPLGQHGGQFEELGEMAKKRFF